MSAPPDNRPNNEDCANNMSGPNHQEQSHPPHQHEQSSNVRHIPIFVEGRDEPVINKSDHGTHYAETKPTYASPPQPPHMDREQYFADDGPPSFHHPPNFSRAFGTPFNKGYRQGPQPFVQQKVYPQTAFARGASPQRSQSPKAQMYPEEQFVKVPVHHDQSTPKAENPSKTQQKQQPKQPPQHQQPPPQQPSPQEEASPQPKTQQPPSSNDPITQILSIQTDVLNLMTDVENFTGTKKDKKYMYLDEMLTRNLIKLDNIETDGKENIRQARKEAIKCIQKCIAVLEAKADNKGPATFQPQDVEMKESTENEKLDTPEVKENGEVEMKDVTKEQTNVEQQTQQVEKITQGDLQTQPEELKVEQQHEENKQETKPQVADTRPNEKQNIEQTDNENQKNNENDDKKSSPKKGTKTKKRDKSKDKKESTIEKEKVKEKKETESMQVDSKCDKDSQAMEVEGATASQ